MARPAEPVTTVVLGGWVAGAAGMGSQEIDHVPVCGGPLSRLQRSQPRTRGLLVDQALQAAVSAPSGALSTSRSRPMSSITGCPARFTESYRPVPPSRRRPDRAAGRRRNSVRSSWQVPPFRAMRRRYVGCLVGERHLRADERDGAVDHRLAFTGAAAGEADVALIVGADGFPSGPAALSQPTRGRPSNRTRTSATKVAGLYGI